MTDRTSSPTFDVELTGCRPEPLASYLKALGVFRLVAEQKDKNAHGFWRGEHFVLRSTLDHDALTRFLVEEWRPTPIIAPWNGGGGFTQSEDEADGAESTETATPLDAIRFSNAPRLKEYRQTIEIVLRWRELPPGDLTVSEIESRMATRLAGLTEKELASKDSQELLRQVDDLRAGIVTSGIDTGLCVSRLNKKNKDFNRLARKLLTKIRGWSRGASKQTLLARARAELPDSAVEWVDATWVLSDTSKTTPLLGTGGNDGNLDFSANFMERVLAVLSTTDSEWLCSSLFAVQRPIHYDGKMGQYDPAVGIYSNPWDFILLIEGALMFAAAATRRYENTSPSMMAFPFHARAAGGLATVTDADESESRDELWLPLWSQATSVREIRRLFAEGRATVGSGDLAHTASSALDFARAVAALGVDRGIDSFTRVGFHVRNGRSYFATPLGRFATQEVRAARLFDEIDGWFDRFRRSSLGKNVPARIALARRRLELAMFDAVGTGSIGPVLLELGDAERALARSLTFTAKAFLSPLPRLQPAWGTAVDDGSVEQRLAAALALRPGMRRRLVPFDESGRGFGRGDEAGFVFADRPLVENLHALLLREDVEALQQDRGAEEILTPRRCSLTDIAHFIDGTTDDGLIERWTRAFVLVNGGLIPDVPNDTILPPASFAVLALVHYRRLGDDLLPRTTGVLARACAGDAVGATERAIRRLNANARPLPVAALVESTSRTRRIAAALAFPLTLQQRRTLERMVLPTLDMPDSTAPDFSQEQV